MFQRFKRLGAALAVASLLCSPAAGFGTVNAAAAGTASTAGHVQIAVDKLNVRSGPGLTYSVIGNLKANTTLPVVAEKDNWTQVALPDGRKGWVASWLVKRTNKAPTQQTLTKQVPGKPNAASQPAAKQQPTNPQPAKQPPAQPQPAKQPPAVKSTGTNVNVRTGPGLTFPVIRQIQPDQSWPLVKKEGQWVQIRLSDKQTGWVAGWLVTATNDETNGSAGPSAHPSEGKTDGVSAGPTGGEGQAAESSPPTLTVLYDTTNVRSGPGTNYDVISRVQSGERYPILKSEGQWYQIQLADGTKGYVAGWLVSADGAPLVIQGDELRGKLIVVDAGHGGNDAGAIGVSLATQEKTINLQVALALKAKLEAAGATVIMTRSDDRALTLRERVEIAVKNKADLFVSVHHNTHPNASTNGTMVFYYKEGESSKLASLVQSELTKATHYKDLGFRFGDYFVLRENPITAILAEVGFISNQEEEANVRSPKQQELAAEGICKGIVRYFQSQSQPPAEQ